MNIQYIIEYVAGDFNSKWEPFYQKIRYVLCFYNVNVYLIKSLEIINQDISDDTIFCSENDDCILICDINNNGNCNGVTMICQNIDNGICKLQCQIICGSENLINIYLNVHSQYL